MRTGGTAYAASSAEDDVAAESEDAAVEVRSVVRISGAASASTWIVAIVNPTHATRPSAKSVTTATGIANAQ